MARRLAPKGSALTDQQERFCREYLKDSNGTQAAIRAGYKVRAAAEQASRLLTKRKVSDRLEQLSRERNKRLEISADMVIAELALIAKVDPKDFFGRDGKLLAVPDMPEHVRRAISSIEAGRLGTAKIRTWEKTKALELLAKHFKLLTDRVEVIEGGMAEGLKKARLRASKR